MTWTAYPRYKTSGVEWLGEIPEHWGTAYLDKLVDALRPITYGIVQPGQHEAGGRFMVRGQDYSNGWSDPDLIFRVLASIEAPYKRARLATGDIVMTIVGAGTGNVAIVPAWLNGANITQTTARVAVTQKKALSRYIAYVLQSTVGQANVSLAIKGAAQPGLNLEHVAKFRIILPPISEQDRIANFLDCETARIDAMIKKKQRQIELLQEKRAALISHAVTNGLNPNVKMKDSGVEWLGKIPQHWEVSRLKVLVSKIGSGKTPRGGAEVYRIQGFFCFAARIYILTGWRLEDVVYIDDVIDSEMASTRVNNFDVLLNITGASLGRCGIVPDELPRANVNQHVCIIRARRSKIDPYYLWLAMCSALVQSQIFANEAGSSREGLNFEQVGNLIITLPLDLEEQEIICRTVLQEIKMSDRLIFAIHNSISKLQEYRIAIISAAVTGKIDVREVS